MVNPRVFMQFRVEPEVLEEIESLAVKLKMNKSHLMRNLIKSGLEDLRIADKVGLVSIVSFMRKNDIKAESVLQMVVENSKG